MALLPKKPHILVAGLRETKVELNRKLPPWLAFRVPEGAMQAAWGEKIWVVFLSARPCRLQPQLAEESYGHWCNCGISYRVTNHFLEAYSPGKNSSPEL